MKRWLRLTIWGVITAGLFFLIGFTHRYQLPKIESWLLQEIERQSQAISPVRVWPQRAKLQAFPPGLILEEIRLLPTDQIAAIMAPTVIDRIEARINWFRLVTGKIRLSYIHLTGAEIKLVIKDEFMKKPSGSGAIEFDVARLTAIPIDKIEVSKVSVWIGLKSLATSMHFRELSFVAENRAQSLLVNLAAPTSLIKWPAAVEPMPLGLTTRVLFDVDRIQLSRLQIKAGDSFAVAAGEVGGSGLNLKSRFEVNLADIRKWESIFRQALLPPTSGRIKADLEWRGPIISPTVIGQVKGESLEIAGRTVGDFEMQGEFGQDLLKIKSASLKHPAGLASINDLSWRMSGAGPINARLEVSELSLNKLLQTIIFRSVPVELEARGRLRCQGSTITDFNIRCDGEISGRDLHVHSGRPKNVTIVKVPRALATGHAVITRTGVTYQAELQVGEKSKGKSQGTIDYEKGFKIDFESERVHFADLANLADLKPEGAVKLKGVTEGNASKGRVTLQARGDDIWLANFGLGQPEVEVTYKDGILSFRKLVGQLGTSRYQGNVALDFHKNELQIQARSPYVDLVDIATALARHAKLPFAVSGTGSLDVRVWGPFAFNKLSYEMNSAFYRGSAAEESFDQVVFNIKADRGQMSVQKAFVARGQSVVDLNGRVSPEGVIDAVVVGRRLRLEESENISRLGLDATGQVEFTMAVRGQLPRPTLDVYGRLSRLVIGDKATDDSTFKLKLLSDRLEGGGNFIGNVVTVDFTLPLTESAPFALRAKTHQWNFANLFNVFSASARQRDIQTSLTGVVDLASEKGGARAANGVVEINEIRLSRGSIGVRNTQPITFMLRGGSISNRGFAIEGEGGFVKGSISELSPTRLNATLNGKIDLSLMTLLTPFLADLQGRAALNISFSGSGLKPELAGSTYIEQGVVRFKQFPHAFTNLRADLLFSEQGMAINALRADLGGGVVTGDGHVKWRGLRQVPIDVRGQVTGVNLNVPEGFRSKGGGTWYFRGSYFPYTLGVNFDVDGGEVVAEFQGTGLSGGRNISPSALLPKFLSQPADQPVTLDLLVNLKNPVVVRNSLLETPIRGKLRIQGSPVAPRLEGVLNPVAGGKVLFRDTPFEIQTGFIEWQNDPPDLAKIYLTAQTETTETVREADNPSRERSNVYEINLLVQGRARQPKITLSSLPALTEREIVSLLALGMTPAALDSQRSAGQIAASNSMQYGAAILQKPISKEVRQRLGVDLQITQTTSTTDNATYPKFTLSRQFTPKLIASASRTLEKNSANSAKMEYKVNRNLSVVGTWDGREGATQLEENKSVEQSVFGLDLEFKVNFK